MACIPRTGIFAFSSNNLNYSQAQISCQKINALLAHIISEERTNGLAKYISLDTPTFVGLSNYNNEKIWENEFGILLIIFYKFYKLNLFNYSNFYFFHLKSIIKLIKYFINLFVEIFKNYNIFK